MKFSVEPTRSPSSKLQIACSFFSEIEFWRNAGRLPGVFNLVCNLDLIQSIEEFGSKRFNKDCEGG